MKRILFFICCIICLHTYAQSDIQDDKILKQLTPIKTDLRFVQIRKDSSLKLLKTKVKDEIRLSKGHSIWEIADNSFIVSSLVGLDKKDYTSDLFSTPTGEHIIVLPKLLIALNDSFTIDKVVTGYDKVLSLEPVQKVKGIYSFSCNLNSSEDVLKLAADIETLNGVKWCEPDMLREWKCCNTNPLFSQQYYLQNTNSGQYDINVVPAWNLQKGSSDITVAVIDDGIEPDHEDLSGNVLEGYTSLSAIGHGEPKNASYLDPKAHGTACAGIIGAKNNNIGIEGVASGVNLLPINIFPNIAQEITFDGMTIYINGSVSDSETAAAIDWAADRADIISCSWGSSSSSNVVKTAFLNALSNGRNGKGCVVVAATGNNASLGHIGFPASIPGVIAVGAIDKDGVIQSYSQRGGNMGLVAPSGSCNLEGDIVTLDRMGYNGYNPEAVVESDLSNWNYTQRFGGTSAACPQVSGVAALVLSKNPNLTSFEVRNLLGATANKLPNMNEESWTNTYGYGLVDAFAAVKMAPYWHDCSSCSISGGPSVCNTETFTLTNVPSNATVTWSFEKEHYSTSSPSLLPNSFNNTCEVQASYSHTFSGTLYAHVQIQGYTAAVISKEIYGGGSFLGYYYDGNIARDVLMSDDNWATPGNTVRVESDDFDDKIVKISRSSSPSVFTSLSVHNKSVSFDMPALSNGEYLTLWIINECERPYIFYSTSASYNSNENPLKVTSQDGTHFLISKESNKNGQFENQIVEKSTKGKDDYWVFRVYNATNLQLESAQLVEGNSYLLDTSSWKSGIYIIRAYIDDKPYSTKISVK